MKIKRLIPIILFAMLFTGCAGGNYRQVRSEEAQRMMEEETGYLIVDVRTIEEYEERHILGAMNIPNESIGEEEIAQLPDKNQLIFVYCRSGRRSKEAAEKLVALGYKNVVEFGGINDWKGETVREK